MCCGLCTVLASTRALDTLPASFSLSPSNSTLGWQPTTVGTTHGYSKAYPLKKSEKINYVAKQRELLVVVHCRFTPGQMLELFKERGWRVGLVIDLTYTNRYYEPQVSTQSPNIFKAPLTSITAKLCSKLLITQDFIDHGVRHSKIKCPGQIIPPDDIYQRYKRHHRWCLYISGFVLEWRSVLTRCSVCFNSPSGCVESYLSFCLTQTTMTVSCFVFHHHQ